MWDVIKCLVLFLSVFFQEGESYIEKVEQSGCESCAIYLTCRHIESIIAVLDAKFEPSDDSFFDRPTVFPPFHPRIALNKRCSGVNHCSFILNKDCPGADKWGTGNVTVKYVCISANRVNKYCNQNITLGFQDDALVASEGFIHNPGYPRFYLGHQGSCRWRIIAQPYQKVRITILDLSIIGPPHDEDNCVDMLEIKESDYTIYSSCRQEQPPIEIISKSNILEVAFTSTETIVPTRGILFHYTAVGCPTPDLPHNAHLISKNDHFAEISCCVGLVFADTKKRRKILTCLGYKWNIKLPLANCENSTTSIEDNTVIKIRYPKITDNMGDELHQAIVIPAIIIALLFIINAVIVFFIYRRRKAALHTITEEEMQVVNSGNHA